MTIEALKWDDYVSSIRNKLLAEAFYLMGDIEKYGTGFLRIRQWLGKYPEISYDIREIGDFFSVEIRQEVSDDLRNDLKTDGKDLRNVLTAHYDLTDNQLKIVLTVMENKYITQQQLSQHIGISPKNIRNNMDKLKNIGMLQRIGPQKGGYWEITLAEK